MLILQIQLIRPFGHPHNRIKLSDWQSSQAMSPRMHSSMAFGTETIAAADVPFRPLSPPPFSTSRLRQRSASNVWSRSSSPSTRSCEHKHGASSDILC
jgi:hypothetical protein